MVDDREVEYGVVGGLLGLDLLGVADPEPHPAPLRCMPSPRPRHHVRVEVERFHRAGAEEIEDDFDADAATATNLERSASGDGPAQIEQAPCLEVALDRGPHGVVHERLLDGVEQHGSGV
jgi:hypothetical protein